jgi:hypothetical protein
MTTANILHSPCTIIMFPSCTHLSKKCNTIFKNLFIRNKNCQEQVGEFHPEFFSINSQIAFAKCLCADMNATIDLKLTTRIVRYSNVSKTKSSYHLEALPMVVRAVVRC